jgi:hypothetical protein
MEEVKLVWWRENKDRELLGYIPYLSINKTTYK